jgi:hypothetical protein
MNKQYDLALNCFRKIGKRDVCLKIEAIQLQERAEEQLHTYELKNKI